MLLLWLYLVSYIVLFVFRFLARLNFSHFWQAWPVIVFCAVFNMCDRILNIDRKEERRINFILMDSGRRKMRSRSDNCEALTGTLYMRHSSHIHKNLKSLQINEVFSLANFPPPIVLWDFAIVCFMFLDSFESYPQVCGLLVTWCFSSLTLSILLWCHVAVHWHLLLLCLYWLSPHTFSLSL